MEGFAWPFFAHSAYVTILFCTSTGTIVPLVFDAEPDLDPDPPDPLLVDSPGRTSAPVPVPVPLLPLPLLVPSLPLPVAVPVFSPIPSRRYPRRASIVGKYT